MQKLKSTLGVTLLEVMLVLAIAAMVIVMSIRYYQAATVSQQANQALSEVQAITAAADNLAMGSGSYQTGNVSTTSITNVVGTAGMLTPTYQPITVTGATDTTYSVSMPLNVSTCDLVNSKLAATKKITTSACDGSGKLTYTYDNTISN